MQYNRLINMPSNDDSDTLQRTTGEEDAPALLDDKAIILPQEPVQIIDKKFDYACLYFKCIYFRHLVQSGHGAVGPRPSIWPISSHSVQSPSLDNVIFTLNVAVLYAIRDLIDRRLGLMDLPQTFPSRTTTIHAMTKTVVDNIFQLYLHYYPLFHSK